MRIIRPFRCASNVIEQCPRPVETDARHGPLRVASGRLVRKVSSFFQAGAGSAVIRSEADARSRTIMRHALRTPMTSEMR